MAKDRSPRYRRLRSSGPKGAIKIFTIGILAAAAYGADVVGVADGELRQLQNIAAEGMIPATRGRSRAALFVAKGDPTWRAAVAPLLLWSQEAWWSVMPKSQAVPCLPIPVLRRAWETASSSKPKGWGQARGCTDAAILSARRIGWKFLDPFHLETDLGAKIPLFDTAPKLVAKLAKDAVQRQWQRKMGAKLKADGWRGARVCPDPITTLLHSTWARNHPL